MNRFERQLHSYRICAHNPHFHSILICHSRQMSFRLKRREKKELRTEWCVAKRVKIFRWYECKVCVSSVYAKTSYCSLNSVERLVCCRTILFVTHFGIIFFSFLFNVPLSVKRKKSNLVRIRWLGKQKKSAILAKNDEQIRSTGASNEYSECD